MIGHFPQPGIVPMFLFNIIYFYRMPGVPTSSLDLLHPPVPYSHRPTLLCCKISSSRYRGFTDGHKPDDEELLMLIKYGASDTYLCTVFFSGLLTVRYQWASISRSESPITYIYVDGRRPTQEETHCVRESKLSLCHIPYTTDNIPQTGDDGKREIPKKVT